LTGNRHHLAPETSITFDRNPSSPSAGTRSLCLEVCQSRSDIGRALACEAGSHPAGIPKLLAVSEAQQQ
jgi:hypothetical protein